MTRTPAQLSLATATTHRRAALFRITRTDGAVLRFTDHNEPLTVAGETYTPTAGFDVSALEQPEGPEDALNASVRGVLTSGAIAEADLRAGRYDGAKVERMVVDYRFPWLEPLRSDALWVSELSYDSTGWEADFVSLPRLLDARLGDIYGRSCRWRLGEAFGDATRSGCKVDLDAFSYFGIAVATVTDRQTFTMTSLPDLEDRYFARGSGLWVTGANAGITFRTIVYTGATRTFTVGDPMPFDIAPGDRANVYAGCDQTSTTCKARFDNFDNYGGFPFLDGQDRATKGVK